MEESHVRKKKGRFIKTGDPIRNAMSITNFNLMEICETSITYADNVDANIIHTKLHLNEDIDQGVKLSNEIETIFEPAEYRPVIKPLDFTQEWIKQRKRMNSRQSRMDEEDEIDIEMENIAKKLRKKFSKQLKKQEVASEEQEVKKIGEQLHFEESIDENEQANVSVKPKEPKRPPPPIPDIQESEDESFALPEMNNPTDPISFEQETMKSVGSAINEIAQPTNDMPSINLDEPMAEDPEDTFVPLAPSNSPSTNTPPSLNQEERQLAFEEAKSQGYEDGFKVGEEKAMVVVQQKVGEILDEFGKIMNEFEGMKSNILMGVQENFQKICQSMMESLLQKEFQINPKSFETILKRAITEAVPDDEFKVLVSQETYEQIKDDIAPEIKSKLKVDQEMKDGNFKVESKLSVVDGNISQIIQDLLDQADIELFDTESDDKAG